MRPPGTGSGGKAYGTRSTTACMPCPAPQPPPIAASRAIATQRMRSALLLGELPLELRGIGGDAEPARRELVEVLRLPVQEAALLQLLHVRRERFVGDAEPRGEPVARVEIGRGGRCIVHAEVLEQDRALQVHAGGPVYHSRTMVSPWSPPARCACRPPGGPSAPPPGSRTRDGWSR